jgi:hypothetical protein
MTTGAVFPRRLRGGSDWGSWVGWCAGERCHPRIYRSRGRTTLDAPITRYILASGSPD